MAFRFRLGRLFVRELAIDLGTATTIIMEEDKIVLQQPSIVAIDRRTEKVIAVGERALQMHEKTHENVKTVRPLRNGVIADFYAAQEMIRHFVTGVNSSRWLSPAWRLVISVPSSVTEVEKRAVREAAQQAGATDVFLVAQPMAAAVGLGLNVSEPVGNMVIDIGGGTTDIAIISLGGIVIDRSIRVAGDAMTTHIMEYVRANYNVLIGERSAEEIKKAVGAALKELDGTPPEPYIVTGRDLNTGVPRQVQIRYEEVAEALEQPIYQIEQAVLKALENCPPELAADLYRNGIYLTGGGSQLRGLPKRIEKLTGLKVHRASEPIYTVALGTGLILKDLENYRFLLS